ncbi:MAG: phytanoyl-CoA dioxygenase family protein [Planctomycetes bacterium]|nr:phytanoyl-CoA dioxygenase family protein [Planctomycetota bacterium]
MLTRAQLRKIHRDGFVRLPRLIPPEMVRAARRAINHSLGEEGMNKEALPTMRAQSYCRELTRDPVILNLLNASPAFPALESAVGPGKLRRAEGSQIALRFPAKSDAAGKPHPHIDGMYTPQNGVKEGTISHFTMLAAVFLSDVTAPNSGNFTVWPGTHRLFESHFRQHTPQSLLQGMPTIEMPEPHQVLARAGDVVLAHYQVGHSVAPNTSPNIRYAVFFRLDHTEHASFGWDVMTDIWLEWAGVRAAVGAVSHHSQSR